MALLFEPVPCPEAEDERISLPPEVEDAKPLDDPVRLYVQRVAVWSVLRTALFLAAVVAGSLVAGGVGAWWLFRQLGVADRIEGSIASGLGMQSYALPTGAILLGWTALAAAGALLTAVVVSFLAVAFNGLSASVGGLVVEVRAERPEPAQS